jgi:hypothetical protein
LPPFTLEPLGPSHLASLNLNFLLKWVYNNICITSAAELLPGATEVMSETGEPEKWEVPGTVNI